MLADSDALVEALCEAEVLADSAALVGEALRALVLADSDALVDALCDAERVLADSLQRKGLKHFACASTCVLMRSLTHFER